jgi:hypothetical protein
VSSAGPSTRSEIHTPTPAGELPRVPPAVSERFRRFHERLDRASRASLTRLWPTTETPPPAKPATEPRGIRNAGLVLLGPFLKALFTEVGYLGENGAFELPERVRAVHLTQYLATGTEGIPETDLILNKLLCGLDPRFPLPLQVGLTPAEKEQCEELIRSCLSQWKPLVNTSVGGFRDSFVRRKGQLLASQLGPILQVERQTLDVLLEYVPWGFRMIKYPWMPQLLTVEW